MSTTDNGGPAFPQHYNTALGTKAGGMSLRDYFAANAMATVRPQTAYNMRANEDHEDYIARCAYRLADAMLKARSA